MAKPVSTRIDPLGAQFIVGAPSVVVSKLSSARRTDSEVYGWLHHPVVGAYWAAISHRLSVCCSNPRNTRCSWRICADSGAAQRTSRSYYPPKPPQVYSSLGRTSSGVHPSPCIRVYPPGAALPQMRLPRPHMPFHRQIEGKTPPDVSESGQPARQRCRTRGCERGPRLDSTCGAFRLCAVSTRLSPAVNCSIAFSGSSARTSGMSSASFLRKAFFSTFPAPSRQSGRYRSDAYR